MSAYATYIAAELRLRLAARLRRILAVVDPYQPKATVYVGQYPPGGYGASGTTTNVKVHFTGGRR